MLIILKEYGSSRHGRLGSAATQLGHDDGPCLTLSGWVEYVETLRGPTLCRQYDTLFAVRGGELKILSMLLTSRMRVDV